MAGRVSQAVTEVLTQPTDANVRLSQEATEALVLPTSQNARITQEATEVLVQPRVTINVPAATIRVLGGIPAVGVVIEVPAATIRVLGGFVAIPLKLHIEPFDVGGIGTWGHDRPFDILKAPLEYSHDRPFDAGQTIGYRHSDPFDIEGRLRITHLRPFDIAGDSLAPLVSSDRPELTPVAGLYLTAPTNGTNLLHVNDTSEAQVGQTVVIGAYTATVTAVAAGVLTLDRVIP